MMKLTLTKAHVDEMIAHARADAPNEACGIIAGRDGAATRLYRMENVAASPYRYEMHGKAILDLLRELDERDEAFLVIYHSHTKTDAYPSPTDVRLAGGWPEQYFVLVSLKEEDAPVVRAFRIIDEEIHEAELTVT